MWVNFNQFLEVALNMIPNRNIKAQKSLNDTLKPHITTITDNASQLQLSNIGKDILII